LDPSFYFGCLLSLWRDYQTHHASVPIVINTQGWIKGIGYDLLLQMLQRFRPSFVVQFFSGDDASKNIAQSLLDEAKSLVCDTWTMDDDSFDPTVLEHWQPHVFRLQCVDDDVSLIR
jgi:polynucleotide 5'-kinase involved in rRNA processing